MDETPLMTYEEAKSLFLKKKDRDSIKTLFKVALMEDDPLLQEEAINLVASKTKFSKKVLRDFFNKCRREEIRKSTVSFTIDRVVKIIPDDPGTEDYLYKFCVTVNFGHGQPEKHEIIIPSSQLVTPKVLQRRLFECTNEWIDLPKGEEWLLTLENMMKDISETVTEEPLSDEWDIAEKIISVIRSMEITDDEKRWKGLPEVCVYDCGDGTIMVSASLISRIARQTTGRFYSNKKLRNILKEYMPDDAKSKRVRVLDGLIRAWFFDKKKVFGESDDMEIEDGFIKKIREIVEKEFKRAMLVEGSNPSISEIGVALEEDLNMDIEEAIKKFVELCNMNKLDYVVEGNTVYRRGELNGD